MSEPEREFLACHPKQIDPFFMGFVDSFITFTGCDEFCDQLMKVLKLKICTANWDSHMNVAVFFRLASVIGMNFDVGKR